MTATKVKKALVKIYHEDDCVEVITETATLRIPGIVYCNNDTSSIYMDTKDIENLILFLQRELENPDSYLKF